MPSVGAPGATATGPVQRMYSSCRSLPARASLDEPRKKTVRTPPNTSPTPNQTKRVTSFIAPSLPFEVSLPLHLRGNANPRAANYTNGIAFHQQGLLDL